MDRSKSVATIKSAAADDTRMGSRAMKGFPFFTQLQRAVIGQYVRIKRNDE
jgi:hypothetical protein